MGLQLRAGGRDQRRADAMPSARRGRSIPETSRSPGASLSATWRVAWIVAHSLKDSGVEKRTSRGVRPVAFSETATHCSVVALCIGPRSWVDWAACEWSRRRRNSNETRGVNRVVQPYRRK